MKNFDPAFVEKIQEIESRKPENMQLQVLADIALMMQDLLLSADSAKKDSQKHVQDFGALLIDFRDQLTSLNKKEAPEAPDYAKPIVEALDKLSAQVKGIDVKPTFTPKIDVKSPDVNVMAPKVDLSELNQTLKKAIPKAFEEAIKLIPQTEIPEQDDSEMLTLLRNLITTTEEVRDKRVPVPAFPKQMVVTNSDGSAIGGTSTPPKDSDRFGIQAISEDATYKYYFFEADDADYYVMRKHLTNKVFSYTAGTGGYATVYQSAILGPSGSPTWGDRGSIF